MEAIELFSGKLWAWLHQSPDDNGWRSAVEQSALVFSWGRRRAWPGLKTLQLSSLRASRLYSFVHRNHRSSRRKAALSWRLLERVVDGGRHGWVESHTYLWEGGSGRMSEPYLSLEEGLANFQLVVSLGALWWHLRLCDSQSTDGLGSHLWLFPEVGIHIPKAICKLK